MPDPLDLIAQMICKANAVSDVSFLIQFIEKSLEVPAFEKAVLLDAAYQKLLKVQIDAS